MTLFHLPETFRRYNNRLNEFLNQLLKNLEDENTQLRANIARREVQEASVNFRASKAILEYKLKVANNRLLELDKYLKGANDRGLEDIALRYVAEMQALLEQREVGLKQLALVEKVLKALE